MEKGKSVSAWEQFAAGERDVVWCLPDGRMTSAPPEQPVGLLSGRFNPLHAGHRQLRQAAEQMLQGAVCYEFPLRNADKPPVSAGECQIVCCQFDDAPVAVTRAATFAEKSRLFPGTVFVVGYDTAVRILDPRFYGGDPEQMVTALRTIAGQDCRFLVAGRLLEGRFRGPDELPVPAGLADLFSALPEVSFRVDISSTELRTNDSEIDV